MIKIDTLKGFVAGVLITGLLATSVSTGFAASVSRNISVTYNNIRIMVDGNPVQFSTDATGNTLEPFVYNGRTYLPVADVGRAVGKNVSWDGATQTVHLNSKLGQTPTPAPDTSATIPSGTQLMDILTPYQHKLWNLYTSNDDKTFSMAGKEYTSGFTTSWDTSLLINLDGQFSEITGTLGAEKFTNQSVGRYVHVRLDGTLYKKYLIKHPDLPQKITIPVNGVRQLEIIAPYSSDLGYSSNHIGFGNIMVK